MAKLWQVQYLQIVGEHFYYWAVHWVGVGWVSPCQQMSSQIHGEKWRLVNTAGGNVGASSWLVSCDAKYIISIDPGGTGTVKILVQFWFWWWCVLVHVVVCWSERCIIWHRQSDTECTHSNHIDPLRIQNYFFPWGSVTCRFFARAVVWPVLEKLQDYPMWSVCARVRVCSVDDAGQWGPWEHWPGRWSQACFGEP